MFSCRMVLLAAALLFTPAFGLSAETVKLQKATWRVGTETREALVCVPAGSNKPLIFAWHGHGGTAAFAARKFAFHTLWPEAVVVYPQGLPTPSPLIDPEGKRSGWQKIAGDQGDRDLKFFDAMMKTCLAEYKADESRVFSAGHSNGGFFTYLLASARGNQLAAIAPVAATLSPLNFKNLKPKPVLHVAGEKDPLVKFAQQERTIERLRKLNGCDEKGKPAGKYCFEYLSTSGSPVVTFIHPGGHEVPDGAAEQIIKFFKNQDRK